MEEKESVERQLKRGREIIAYNERMQETGVGMLLEERVTDLNEESCRKRYRVFMDQTYSVLQSLKEVFHFHIINAQGDIASVERAIRREFQYQSTLELDDETFDAIRRIPLASESCSRPVSTSSSASNGISAIRPTCSDASSRRSRSTSSRR